MGSRFLFLAAGIEPAGERWSFTFGDPSLLAWLCVLGYLATAWMCLSAWRAASRDTTHLIRTLWMGLCVGLVGLGINKQLDLQVLLIDIGRNMAGAEGWYARRRIILGVFLALLGLIGISAAYFALRKFQPKSPARTALAGFTALGMALLLQAAPWRPIRSVFATQFFDKNAGIFEVHLSELIELAILAVVALAARRYCQTFHVEPQNPEKQPPPVA